VTASYQQKRGPKSVVPWVLSAQPKPAVPAGGFSAQLFLLCGRSDRISAGIAFLALVSLGTLLAHCAAIALFALFAFFALRSLGTRRTWIALRTFKTSRESERCNELPRLKTAFFYLFIGGPSKSDPREQLQRAPIALRARGKAANSDGVLDASPR
jgi:hypothetical protein